MHISVFRGESSYYFWYVKLIVTLLDYETARYYEYACCSHVSLPIWFTYNMGKVGVEGLWKGKNADGFRYSILRPQLFR